MSISTRATTVDQNKIKIGTVRYNKTIATQLSLMIERADQRD